MSRPQPKPTGRVRDREYMAYVSGLPCVLRGVSYRSKRGDCTIAEDCGGRIEVNHAGSRPMGRKCSDLETLPMCRIHHACWTDFTGFFDPSRMTLDERHAWRDEKIALVRKAFNENREASEEGGVSW